MAKKTLVIGASEKESRYSNSAIELLQKHGHPVVAIGSRNGAAHGISITKEMLPFEKVHTITLYINSSIQESYKDYIKSLNPSRVIFNPGTENKVLYLELNKLGISTIEACTLVMIKTNQY